MDRFVSVYVFLLCPQNDLQNLQDAEDEMMIALDTDEKVPFMVGEVFIMKSQVSLGASFTCISYF